jgi:hypothetical protein
MYPRVASIVIAAFLLVPGVLAGQQVDPGVNAIDPTVNSRVQDSDRPNSASLPGGSAAWTGQPIMSQTPSVPVQRLRVSQFPSLAGTTSKWAPTFSALSSASGVPVSDVSALDAAAANASTWTGQAIMTLAPSVAAEKARVSQFPSLSGMSTWGMTPSASATDASAVGAPDRARSVLSSTKTAPSRKLNMKLSSVDLHSAKSSSIQDELALLEQNQMTLSSVAVDLRKLRAEAARSSRSARLKIADPLHAKADAASAGLWHSDQSSARALAQQQDESGMLLQNGFGHHKKSGHRHRDKSTMGSQRWSR